MTGCSETLTYSTLDYFAITVVGFCLFLVGIKILVFLWDCLKKAIPVLAKGIWHLLMLVLEGLSSK